MDRLDRTTSSTPVPRRRLLALAAAMLTVSPLALAEAAPSSPPSTQPAFPELQRLNTECVTLFDRMQGSILRVQMPAPRWNNDIDNDARFQKFNLNPDVKQNIQQRANRGVYNNDNDASRGSAGGNTLPPTSNPTPPTTPTPTPGASRSAPPISPPPTKPSEQQSGQQQIVGGRGDNYIDNKSQQGYTIIVPQPQIAEQQAPAQQQQALNAAPGNRLAFAANNVGILLGDRHVLVPTYVEREAVGDQPIRLALGNGDPVFARLVGSDQQTQLTVLRLSDPVAGGKAKAKDAAPVGLSDKPLPDGSVVLMLSPVDGSARLAVWTNGTRDVGVVVTIEGQIAGIARHGQFLSGGACQLIADQIIRHGAVRRATLGVIISQVEAGDPARQVAELGQSPAVRIDQVMKDSVAERGGLKKGDLILSLAGEPVHNIPTLAAAIAARQGPTEVRVMREGKIISMRVDLIQK